MKRFQIYFAVAILLLFVLQHGCGESNNEKKPSVNIDWEGLSDSIPDNLSVSELSD